MSEYRGRTLFNKSIQITFTPGQGTVSRTVMGGPAVRMKGLERLFRSQGHDTAYRGLGKAGELEVTRNLALTPSGRALPDPDRWGLTTEVITQDLFALPKIATEANTFGGTDGPKDFRDQIEDAVKDGTDLEGSIATSAIAQATWDELRRGTDSYETETLVLSRTRSTATTVSRSAILSNADIYTTSNLANTFGIPSSVLFNLPDNPGDTPTNAAWGWRISDQSLDAAGQFTKFEDVLSWKFAAWSTFYYNQI